MGRRRRSRGSATVRPASCRRAAAGRAARWERLAVVVQVPPVLGGQLAAPLQVEVEVLDCAELARLHHAVGHLSRRLGWKVDVAAPAGARRPGLVAQSARRVFQISSLGQLWAQSAETWG